MTVTTTALAAALTEFHARAIASTPVAKLLARWDRVLEIRAPGAAGAWFFQSREGRLQPPTTVAPGRADMVLSGPEDVLVAVFTGELNPARAHLDGELQVTGAQKDQLVLDSIVLLIWGY